MIWLYLSICSGLAPGFNVICPRSSLASMIRLQPLEETNIEHGRHLEYVFVVVVAQNAEGWNSFLNVGLSEVVRSEKK